MAARFIGVKVEEFGFGLPPRMWGKKIRGTIYSLNWLPIVGFVKLAGEDDQESANQKGKEQKLREYFFARSKKERAVILLAGVTMNFVLAVGISTYLLTQGVMEQAGRIHIESILPDSPAALAGLLEGDQIKSVYLYPKITLEIERELKTPRELIDFVKTNAGREITVSFIRNGQPQVTVLIPRVEYPPGQGPMGVAISDLELKKYPLAEAPLQALKVNLLRAREMLASIGGMLWQLVTLKGLQADVAGPIGIAAVTGQAVKYGFRAILEFMSILSLNLAVLNVLPIPALDGGRLLFVFLEKFIGKRIKPAFERSTHQIGMIVLLILVVLISINDILRLARGG